MSTDQPTGDQKLIEAVADHWERFLGPCTLVYDEIVSELIHVDVYQFGPDPETGVVTLVTSGMAEKPMNVPTGVTNQEDYQYCELILQVHDSWIKELKDGGLPASWAFRELKSLVRFPHKTNSWVWGRHTFCTEQNAPYSQDTEFTAAILYPSYGLPPEAAKLQLDDGRKIEFFTLGFLFPEEYVLYKKLSFDGFLDHLDAVEADFFEFLILTPNRANLCSTKKPWWKRK